MKRNELIAQIYDSLLNSDVSRVILFGSYSKGTQTTDSDIDLLVVTNDNFIPSSFAEKMKMKLKIAKTLHTIRKNTDIDLIVYSKPMYEKFVELDSSFKREVFSTGTIIYEANN